MHVEFILSSVDPKNTKDEPRVLAFASALAKAIYGDEDVKSPPEINHRGFIDVCPITNDYWLYPPDHHLEQAKGHWRLVARNESVAELTEIVVRALRFFQVQVDFTLPNVDPQNKERVLAFANALMSKLYPDEDLTGCSLEINDAGFIEFCTGWYWLYPPGYLLGQSNESWRLVSRSEKEEGLLDVVNEVKQSFQ